MRARTRIPSADGLQLRQMVRTPDTRKGPPPSIMIDNRLATEAELAAFPEDRIASVSILKGDGNAVIDGRSYPNGLIVVSTKSRRQPFMSRPVPTSVRRTDTTVVSGANTEARASKMWGLVSESAMHSDGAQRVAVLPNRAPGTIDPLRTITASGESSRVTHRARVRVAADSQGLRDHDRRRARDES